MYSPLSYFLFQPVLHDLCNIGHGMYYSVCLMVHVEDPLLLIGKNSKGSRNFPNLIWFCLVLFVIFNFCLFCVVFLWWLFFFFLLFIKPVDSNIHWQCLAFHWQCLAFHCSYIRIWCTSVLPGVIFGGQV